MEQQLKHKIDTKTKPLGSLGKLEDIALKIGKIQHTLTPKLTNPTILVFAADHGIADEGVSLFPKEVTYQMVMNFLNGGAAINVFCRQNNINLKVVDAGVDFDFPADANLIHAKIARGTQNMRLAPAMSIEICKNAIKKGREIVAAEHENGCNVIGFGEMGIANTSAASLLMHKYFNIPLEESVGRGTGHDEAGVLRKYAILKEVSGKHPAHTPLEILATFGGIEIAMMCGAIMEAKQRGMVILADGFIATSSFIAAYKMQPDVLDNTLFCHSSNEKGHKLMLEHLHADPVLHLNLRLGEGTGAALAYPIIQSAVNFLNEMASFEQAGVSDK